MSENSKKNRYKMIRKEFTQGIRGKQAKSGLKTCFFGLLGIFVQWHIKKNIYIIYKKV